MHRISQFTAKQLKLPSVQQLNNLKCAVFSIWAKTRKRWCNAYADKGS